MNDQPDASPALPRLRQIAARSSWLALGEGFTRLANFLIVVVVANTRGPEGLGVFAIGQLVGNYLILGTDFGFKTMGARFVSLHRAWTRSIVRAVQQRRRAISAVLFPAGLLYAFIGPVPEEARPFVAGFAMSVLPQAFTLDWTLLGLERFALLGLLRAGVALLFAIGAGVWLMVGGGLGGVATANGIATLIGALAVWFFWFRKSEWGQADAMTEGEQREIRQQTAIGTVAWLGLATIAVQMFQTIDTLMLGGMVPVDEVGRYNGAHKIVVLVFGVYYLFTQSMLPTLARLGDHPDAVRKVLRWTLWLSLLGVAAGSILALIAAPLLELIYGRALADAAPAMRWLSATIPLEFALAFMGTALVAWKRERLMLALAAVGLLVNVTLNLLVIPMTGLIGAAQVKVVSYVIVVVFLWLAVRGSHSLRRLSDALDRWGRA